MTNKPSVAGRELVRGDRLFHIANSRSCDRGWVEYLSDDGLGEVTVRHRDGAVPTVKLLNLQWEAMTEQQELDEFYAELSEGNKLSGRALCHIRALNSELAALRAELGECKGEYDRAVNKVEALRDQLTERDALLIKLSGFARFVIKCVRRNGEYAPLSMQEPHEIEAALSASAEPASVSVAPTLWEMRVRDEPGNPESPCEYVYVNNVAERDALLHRGGASVFAEYTCTANKEGAQ
ncbi:MAG: hypothetical protein KKC55_16425 [Gammaproteobacteria bacterium]|uniref:Uncharacterized protein n=1 Tax=viral metagenome TaxID=1070528 RepID=A0A6M3M0T2_9ZZZZ|nr:hypothetical protein [Gammaproteobacteria bacterium]